MQYTKISLLGRNGFIGSALAKRFNEMGVEVVPTLDKTSQAVFLFNSPSSVILYNEDLTGCIRETIEGFLTAIDFCLHHDIKLFYPSSATVYHKRNSYARCKSALEELQHAYPVRSLAYRISAGYGPGEAHKGKYASIIYNFCKQMKAGEVPTIWGDGTQTRDFIYIDDIMDQIISNMDNEGYVDICSGTKVSFNRVVTIINEILGTEIEPIYIEAPKDYVQELDSLPYQEVIPIEVGIRRVLEAV